ncbi:hypothetical protein [Streptomyces abikoensis]
MKDSWGTHHWPEGERRAHWHVLFDNQPAAHASVRDHAELLDRHREFTQVPVEGLHAAIRPIAPSPPARSTSARVRQRPPSIG